jgi:hypothetical protein
MKLGKKAQTHELPKPLIWRRIWVAGQEQDLQWVRW